MDRAINKSTGEIISAFEVYKNGSYQNLTKGEWIAPTDKIYNWDEISEEDSYVHYVKETFMEYKSGKKVPRSPYFAKFPGSKAKTIEENKEHQMITNWLFKKLKEDDLEIIYSRATKKWKYDNSNKLSELKIDWNNYSIEIPIRSMKNLRADILLPFKKKHNLLGFGLIIEIQLSSQSEKVIYDRSIDRAINGYSTLWLFKKDFDVEEDNIELKNNKHNILSFASELKYEGKNFVRNLKNTVENQCRYLDIKKEELENFSEEIYKDIKKRLSTREMVLFNKIKSLEGNPFEQLVEKYKEDISEKGEKMINELKEMQEKFNPRIMPCKRCNQGYMIFKITPQKQKELYECQACKSIIWVK